jgi:hypothetical protein
MGILDDAIREHLELKRSHGASEEEVRRQEAEVFGPIRQDAAPAAAAEPAPEEHTQLLTPDEREEAERVSEPEDEHGPPVAEAGAGMLESSHVEPGPPVAPEHRHHRDDDEQHPALVDHDHIPGEEEPPEPVFGHAPEAPTTPREGEAGEDVLEETPEFLQDAPEHDRLWFEQKPPRDFDFDE